MYKILKVQY